MTRYLILTILLLIICNVSQAQLETSNWYFGRNAGLDFKTENPTILTDGALDNWEGVATFSDSLGNLLFYTDGQTIWNREHDVMVNGDGLIGHHGSTESAIIVPWPENEGKYYVFVVDENGCGPLSYSIVDMSLDEGRGAVTDVKNVILEDLVVEKVTAIRHTNQKAFWILTRVTGCDNDAAHTPNDKGRAVVEYLLDKNGLSTPQYFNVGTLDYSVVDFFSQTNAKPFAVGYMRVSPDGQLIACATSINVKISGVVCSVLDVYKFNPTTGEVDPYLVLYDEVGELYGVEFSNDASKLYYSTYLSIYQVDLSLPTILDIKQSAIQIGYFDYELFGMPLIPDLQPFDYPSIEAYILAMDQQTPHAGALQLAINGKIYVAQNNCEYLGVINNPREKGTACNFETRGQYLGGKKSQMGLPNFIPTYFLPPNFTVEDQCVNKKVKFTCTDDRQIDSYEWVISDVEGNKIYQSPDRDFEYSFANSGTYRVTLTIKIGSSESSEYRLFKVFDPPVVTLPEDVTICKGDEYEINPTIPEYCDYVWSNGCTDLINTINESTNVSLTVTNIFTGCFNSDDMNITTVDPMEFSLGNDREFCEGGSVTVDCELNFQYKSFVWTDNSASALSRVFKQPGKYTARLTDMNNCIFENTINIRCNPLPLIDFKTDDVFCRDSFKIIDCNVPETQYLWSTGETTRSIKVSNAGEYSVIVTDAKGCVSTDLISLEEYTKPELNLMSDTLICDDVEFSLSANWPDAIDYIWQNDTHGNEILVETPGMYTLTIVNLCGTATDSVDVSFRYCGEFVFPNIITPNGDGLNDYFKIKGLEYTSGWSMTIFNREGRKVFESKDYRNNWNAPDLSDGVYFYIMEKNGERFKGNVSVFHK